MWEAFARLFHEGGWVLYPIFATSMLAWFVGFGKLAQYVGVSRARKRFLGELRPAAPSNGSTGDPTYDDLLRALRTAVGRPAVIRNSYATFMAAMTPSLDRGLSTMVACIVAAPLLGLLGTITGMNDMFAVIGQFGFGSPTILASGISMALEATLTGLGVAVASLFFLDYLTGRKARLAHVLRNDVKTLYGVGVADEVAQSGATKGDRMQGDYGLVSDETDKPEINLAPFVDTIMILLIFFVVTANLYVETGVDVTKPRAQSAKPVGQKAMLVGVTREGTVHVYGRQVSLERLRMLVEQEVARQSEVSVVIVADRDAVVGRAVEVMDQCSQAGVHKISMAAGKE